MQYVPYMSFIDYLVSDEAKTNPYQGTCVFLVSGGDFSTFNPYNDQGSPNTVNGYDLTYAYVKGKCHPVTKFDYSQRSNILCPGVFTSDTNAMTTELQCYEKSFNEPCSAHIANSSYVQEYMDKMLYDDTTEDTMTGLSETFGFKTEFDQDEYYKWDIPMTPLNNADACLSGQNVALSGTNLVPAKGFLYAIQKEDRVIPFGYCDFVSTSICSYYGITWNRHGIIKLS